MKFNHGERNQSGLSLIGFIIVLGLVGLCAYIGMKLAPMYMEYYSVRQALRGLANEPGVGDQDPARIKDLFFRRLYINYSENVKPEHVKIERLENGNGWNMSVAYELRKPLIANLDVVGRFDASQILAGGGGGGSDGND